MKQKIQVNKKKQEYVDVWQKPSQYCKVIILWLNQINHFLQKKRLFSKEQKGYYVWAGVFWANWQTTTKNIHLESSLKAEIQIYSGPRHSQMLWNPSLLFHKLIPGLNSLYIPLIFFKCFEA